MQTLQAVEQKLNQEKIAQEEQRRADLANQFIREGGKGLTIYEQDRALTAYCEGWADVGILMGMVDDIITHLKGLYLSAAMTKRRIENGEFTVQQALAPFEDRNQLKSYLRQTRVEGILFGLTPSEVTAHWFNVHILEHLKRMKLDDSIDFVHAHTPPSVKPNTEAGLRIERARKEADTLRNLASASNSQLDVDKSATPKAAPSLLDSGNNSSVSSARPKVLKKSVHFFP